MQNLSWNILDVKFHVGGRMRNWKVLVMCDGVEALSFKGPRDERLINFIKAFNNKCKNNGRQRAASDPCHGPAAVDQGRPWAAPHAQALKDTSRTVESFGKAKNISFILSLLQKKDDFIYPGIKRLCVVKFGVRSQCLFLKKARASRTSICPTSLSRSTPSSVGSTTSLVATISSGLLRSPPSSSLSTSHIWA